VESLALRGHQLTRFIHYDLPAWSGDHLLDSTGQSGTAACIASHPEPARTTLL